ncbi:MAG: GTP-binding protein [Candidatus Omnitrophica bacterium]|nr:GTP-binding protein [Candidatus Omnitrophota bacterium]
MRKDVLKIVVIGHVDHGKSTLIGRLLLDTDSLPDEKITEIKRICKELGKETELAYLVDQLKEEREHAITIDTTQIFFKTHRRNYVIIDAPGHVEFIKNMLTGASLAEAAILMIDVQEGVMEQTRRHAYLINFLGLNRVIVVFNKMDLIDYKKERFDKVKTELLKFLGNLKIKPFFLIPVSAKEGTNLSKKSQKMNWYKGPTLLKALDSLKLNTNIVKRPLRFPIQDIYEINGEKIIVGRIASGMVKQGQEVVLCPSFKGTRINSIRVFGKRNKTKAKAGESIGLTFNRPLFVKRGEVVAQKETPPKLTNRFKGNIFWMSDKPLYINKTITLRCAAQKVECGVEKIEKRIDPSRLETIQVNAKELKRNEIGIVVLKTKKMIVMERFNFIEELGRFILEQQNQVCAGGIITEKLLA